MSAVRRFCGALLSRFANRRVVYAIAAVSTLAAKLFHIFAHLAALPRRDVLRWGLSFFWQDVLLLLGLRVLLDGHVFAETRLLQILAPTVAFAVTLAVLMLAAIDISFFLTAGSELSWRNAGLASDSSSWSTLMSGLLGCSVVLAAILVASWITQDLCFWLTGLTLDVLRKPVSLLLSKLPRCHHWPGTGSNYSLLQQQELEKGHSGEVGFDDETASEEAESPSNAMVATNAVISLILLMLFISTAVRPAEHSLVFMSWTLALLPFVEFSNSSPALASLVPVKGRGIGWDWDALTALGDPIHYSWLPGVEDPLPGFEDWYRNEPHYRADSDPLKISNLDEGVLPGLRNKLQDVQIRHVMLVKLESTRKDVFPIRREGEIWRVLAGSFEGDELPAEAVERLSTLTPTANFLTGDYVDGFEHETQKRRGGINANQDITTSTYTLKSIAGTWCGLTGLVADFNQEVYHHVYQPCLPHIFNAFNHLNKSMDVNSGPEFTSHKWKSLFMQSVTLQFDHQDDLMALLGFSDDAVISKEYLCSDNATFPEAVQADVNYYGMPEVVLERYFEDLLDSAIEHNERLFLGHLTSTSHHPFGLPEGEQYTRLAGDARLDDLSHYVNAIGYVDRWLGRMLEILDEKGIANETLIVYVGDHGLSIPETGAITPYLQPNMGNFHVPLVLSHPLLPPIDIGDPVVSLQILPTILDLLIETGSLSRSESQAARDLIQNYEGQSLIRPMRRRSDKGGQPDWQFTVMNPGRATIAVRDASRPHWRLVAPIMEDQEWRFSDLEFDPKESAPLRSFSFTSFLSDVEATYGERAAEWAEEAAFMCRWWVEENAKRWRYSPE